jgi:hypothetical protein
MGRGHGVTGPPAVISDVWGCLSIAGPWLSNGMTRTIVAVAAINVDLALGAGETFKLKLPGHVPLFEH